MMATPAARTLPFWLVPRQVRRHHCATLSTVGPNSQAQSAGVSCAVSTPGAPLARDSMSRTHLHKTRNIARNLSVSLVMPLPRRLRWFLPPPTIHLRGRSGLLDQTNAAGKLPSRSPYA